MDRDLETDLLTTSVARPPTMRSLASRVGRASAIYGISNLGLRALNFLLLPIYTRYLTPSAYGVMALAETAAVMIAVLFGMGMDASLQRLYFQHVDHPLQLQSFLGSALKFSLLIEAVIVLLVVALGKWGIRVVAPGSMPISYLIIAVVTAAATQIVQYRLILFQAEAQPWRYVVLSFVVFFFTAAFTLGLVVSAHRGAGGMLAGRMAAAVLAALIAVYLFRRVLQSSFRWDYVRDSLWIGLPLIPHQLMAGGLIAADRFILGHYRDLSEVGLYSVAYTFGMVMSLVTMSLNQAWSPVYYDLARQGERERALLGRMVSLLVVALSAVACIGALMAQDFIKLFLDARYSPAGKLVPWLIGGYLAHSLFSIFSLALMQAKKTHKLILVSFIALAVNTVFNFILIPHWGMRGAAYATVIGYAVEAVVMYRIAQNAFRLSYDLLRVGGALAVFAAALMSTVLLSSSPHRAVELSLTGVACLTLLALIGLRDMDLVALLRRRAFGR